MRKLSAILILVIVYFPLAFATLTLAAIRSWALDRGFYEHIVSDERLYEAALTDEIPRRVNNDTFTSAEQLPLDALSIALREVLTVDYLRAQSLHVVDQVFDYLEGRDRDFELVLDISPVKTALLGERRASFAAALAAELPLCDGGQQPIAPGGRLTRCIAAESSVEAAAEQIAAALPAVLEDAPDHIVVNDETLYVRMNWYNFAWFRGSGVHTVLDMAILMMIATALGVGFVGAYLGGDDLRGRLKWLSSALFAPGSLFVLVGLALASPYIAVPISNSMASVRYSHAFRDAVTNIAVQVIQQIGSGLLLTGLVASMFALGLLILSLATPARGPQNRRMVQVPVRHS